MSQGAFPSIASLRPVRFGVLCDGPKIPMWQARSIEELRRVPGTSLALVVFPADKLPDSSRPTSLLFRAYLASHPPRSLRPLDMALAFQGVPSLRCHTTTQDGLAQRYDESDVRRIRAFDLDFLLQCGSCVLDGEILRAARYGVWSFQHDDGPRSEGIPTFLWPIYDGDAVTVVVLRRSASGVDNGIALRSGYFRTALHSLRQNVDQVHFGVVGWPANVCQDLRLGQTAYLEAPAAVTPVAPSRIPTNRQMMRFLVRQTRHAVRRAVRGLVRHEQWCIGVADVPIDRFLEARGEKRVRWLNPPERGRFIADPFGAQIDGVTHILYEDFRYATSKGVIGTIEAAATGPPRIPRVAIELPVHASYPYLVVDREEIYCIPETNASREIGLHRAVVFPTRWEKIGTLVSGVAALDPTVFRHEGRWWLTCTDREIGENMPLFVWHARNLEGPWEPHALNPVKTDIRSSRPAGTPFVHGGILYRPAQDCSRMYGGRIVINRVVRLTPTEFSEEPAATVEPFSEGPFPDAIHTLSGVGEITLIDSKRHRFVPSAIPYVLRNRPVPARDRTMAHRMERG